MNSRSGNRAVCLTSCVRCSTSKTCTANSDCSSNLCSNGLCTTATCSDGVKNGTETDVDCGGSCSTKCGTGKVCSVSTDCQSLNCLGGICQVATCSDTIKNGAETDVDCGGGTCSKCVAGKSCSTSTDCVSLVCSGTPKTCQAATCSDGVKNQTETDIDCGGACQPGQRCDVGEGCSANTDCLSDNCVANVCQEGSGSSLVIRYSTNDNPDDNYIRVHLRLYNPGSHVDLAGYSIRYWFTREGTSALASPPDCWGGGVPDGCGSLGFSLVPVSPARTGANYYLSITFSSGSLDTGAETDDISIGIHKNDWSNFAEGDDYSFNAALTTWTENDHCTLYDSGALVWGIEP